MVKRTDALVKLGWDSYFESHFQSFTDQGFVPARVAAEHRHTHTLFTAQGEVLARISGRFRHEAATREGLPVVGDWVAATLRLDEQQATIHGLLPRRSAFMRKVAGRRTEEQVAGANIDTVFLMTSLNQDFNLRRLERYLATAWESGARPVIILSKSDLCSAVGERAREVEATAHGVPIHPISVPRDQGIEALFPYLRVGQTVALLGSSGVGKSTLINRLIGHEVQRVTEVRPDDGRGRHTTTHRELIALPGGALILDTPGMREIQPWEAESGMREAFDDIELLGARCRFSDCRHELEPGCAVRSALEKGDLDARRLLNYQKLRDELAWLAARKDRAAQKAEKQRWKKLSRMAKERAVWKRR